MHYKYLIIGNSAGGIGAVEAIRSVDRKGSLAIISDEPHTAYSRPMIHRHLSGQVSFDDMVYRPSSFYEEKNVDTLLGEKAVQIHPKVILEDGRAIAYDRLLIATGGKAFMPKIEGLEKKGIYTFTTIKDSEEIRARILGKSGTHEVVVMGGGLIGMLAAEALASSAVNVTVVEFMKRILGSILDETASAMVKQVVEQNGVKVITGHTISEILGKDEVEGVLLDDDRLVKCDLLIIAVGVIPSSDLAKEAGLTVNKGIVVNKRLETSLPGIYACGDCAELYDFVNDCFRPLPIWPAAYESGMVAGYNMAGLTREYDGGTGMNSISLFDFPIISIGRVNNLDQDGCEVLFNLSEKMGTYRKIVLKEKHVVGAILLKEIDRAGIILDLMKKKVDVSSFKESLLREELGLIHLPKLLRHRMIEVT